MVDLGVATAAGHLQSQQRGGAGVGPACMPVHALYHLLEACLACISVHARCVLRACPLEESPMPAWLLLPLGPWVHTTVGIMPDMMTCCP